MKAIEYVHDEHVPCGIELDMDAIRMMPSSISTGVIVVPKPTSTLKASSAVAPANAPCCQVLVRKLVILVCHVF